MRKANYLSLILVSMTLLSGMALSRYVVANAEGTSANASVHVSEACSMSAGTPSNDSISVDNSTFTENVSLTKFTVKCNDASGFAIYAIGYSNDTYGTTDMVGSTSGLTIPTGTDALNGNTTSHWSMLVAKDTSSYLPANLTIENNFNNYHVIPDDFTKIASFSSSTDGVNGTGSAINTSYAVRISATQAADTYVGKVKYVLVHPSTMVAGTYSINYLANGGSGSTMSSESNIYNFENHTLALNTYTAPSWSPAGFQGWCTTNTSQQVCSDGTLYTDGADIPASSVSAGGNATLNLYAIWGKPITLNEATYLQDKFSCELTSAGTMKVLIDNRDNTPYHVKKLADGKCWMLDNLALNIADPSVKAILSSANTNATDTDLNALRSKEIDDGVINGDTNDTSGYYRMQLASAFKDDTSTCYGEGNCKYGIYYNYCAASAGTYCTEGNLGNASSDICPANWRMPTGGENSDYRALCTAYDSNCATNGRSDLASSNESSLQYNLSTPFAGWAVTRDGVVSKYLDGYGGYFWSSSISGSSTIMINLMSDNTGVQTGQQFVTRNYGISMRCVYND